MTQVQCLRPSWLFEPCMLWMNSSPKAYDWTLLEMETQFVSWIILSTILEPNKGVYTWSTWKAKSSQGACPPSVSPSHFKQIPKDHNQGSSLPSASPSHFIIIKVLKHPQWTKKKQAAQLCLTLHLVCNVMVKLKVPCFYVSLNPKNPCSIWCTLLMYIYIYFKKYRKYQDFQIFPKKREKFSTKKKKKSLD